MIVHPCSNFRVLVLAASSLVASCAPMGFTLSNMNPETRGDVARIYKSVVSVDPPAEFSSLDVSELAVTVFEESRAGKLRKTRWQADLSKSYVNDTDFYWRVDVTPNSWKVGGYRLEFSRRGDVLFGVSADFRYEFISPYDY